MPEMIYYVFILINFLAVRFSNELEVKYEMIEDFGPHIEERFERSIHEIVRRAANSSIPPTNSSIPPTNGTTKVSKPTSSAKSNNSMTQSATPSTGQVKTTSAGYSSVTPTNSSKVMSTTPRTNVTNNISSTEDNHRYYTSQYYDAGANWWINLEDIGTPKLHYNLSKNFQYSDTLKISFTFPYYGHLINKVTLTNKGFLFLGNTLHKFNASAQYVAPLMADFAPHLHQDTSIRYIDTGDRFTAEWNSIRLKNQTGGEFSFQCSIFKNGTLVFAYKKIPIPVSQIKNDTFFVRVGVSDSFKLSRRIHGLYRIGGRIYTSIQFTVYYLYHKIQLAKENVKSGSAFVLTPVPNCITFKTCNSCVKSRTEFSCAWCPQLKRCSDGIDRHRQEWQVFGCLRNSRKTTCPVGEKTKPTPTSGVTSTTAPKSGGEKGANKKESRKSGSGFNVGLVILIIFCLGILLAISLWVLYAYRRPQSTSGMFLIQYGNPRKWFKNSSVRDEPTGGKVTFKSMLNESIA